RLGKDRLGKDSSSKEEIPATTTQPNAHDFYQNNFGIENPTVMQTIEMWIEDLNQELVIEAMRRAAIDQKGFRYAEGIMRNWDKKNIRTMEQVEAEDVAFANQSKKKTSYSKQPVRKEVLPDWAKDDYEEPKEKPASVEDQQAFRNRLEKIRSKKKVEEK
ncbi:DnaD domain-containing protein, partial [Pisciglobus halotolerans]